MTPRQVLIIAFAALLLPIAWIEFGVLHYTHGIVAYPLDDTFIHMTVARNLALHHYWGVTGGIFASASSSPFFTFLLAAAFLLFGVHTVIPLLLNILAGIILIWTAHRWLGRQGLSPLRRLLVLLLFIFLTPLPLAVISGMEHTFQLLFCFLFIFSFADAQSLTPRPGKPWTIYIYGMLMIATRYECLTILGMACLILLYRRRWVTAISLFVISILPIVAFGLYAMSKGSYFMPNSVLLKSNIPHHLYTLKLFFQQDIWVKMFFAAHNDYNFLVVQRLLLLLPLCGIIFFRVMRERPDYRYILIILLGAVLGHIAFAYPANFPRYEDYLVGCSILLIGAITLEYAAMVPGMNFRGAKWVAGGVLVLLTLPFLIRTELVFARSGQYCINIYEQQYQMARFVHDHYDGTPLAFNDIGAISFYSTGPKLDLFGLASLEVAKSRHTNRWTADVADSLVRLEKIKLAIVYDTWQDPKLLCRWRKVASWQNYNNVVLGDDSVSFYSISATDTAELRRNLEMFQPSLPQNVTVRYY